jgi:hypothetical protein
MKVPCAGGYISPWKGNYYDGLANELREINCTQITLLNW